MVESRKQDIIRKIEALLAKAASTQHSEEAELFASKAQELMTRYQVEEAMFRHGHDRSNSKPVEVEFEVRAPYAKEKGHLLLAICTNNDCICLRVIGGKTDEGQIYKVLGFEEDIDMVRVMYASLNTQMIDFMFQELDTLDENDEYPDNLSLFKRSFFRGFSTRINERFREARSRIIKEEQDSRVDSGPSVALVLQDKKKMVEEMLRGYRISRDRSNTSYDWRHYESGKSAGSRASLGNQGRVGETSTKALCS